MTDIVERLRILAAVDNCQASIEAADEITRLRAEVEKMRADIAYADKHASKVESLLWGTAKENEKLRTALEEIIQDSFSVYAIQVARAALSGDKHE
jgi:type II secretory pathway component PulM